MTDDVPPLSAVGPHYDRPLELADRLLDGPIQTRIRTWEDGEFEVRVWHGHGPHSHRPGAVYRDVLRYHSGDDETVREYAPSIYIATRVTTPSPCPV